jgi:N-acetyl-anhydromuramyl-L-alanine amidase AmpD
MNRTQIWLMVLAAMLIGCTARKGDEIVACGQRFHTGTRVVLWTDPNGFDAYRAGSHFNARASNIQSLPQLRQVVDQFVIHYDACGSSRKCFEVLSQRKLSVHFMLDTDGTIYQTLDLKERAWHATISNSRSVGIEIANVGASATPSYPNVLQGEVQGQMLYQPPFTPQQYDALIKLTAALCEALPRIEFRYPASNRKLSDVELANFHGVLGHYHVQSNKQDPGPAFQWDRVINGARAVLR